MQLFVLAFIAMVTVSLLLFDVVLRQEHRAHPQQWRQDGCPWGFFIFPRETGFWAGCKARNVVFRQWLVGNPAWLETDPVAMRYVYLFRISVAMGCLIWAFVMMLIIKTP